MNGFINLFKPQGITSNKAVLIVRKMLSQKKIGHSGTLDPGAAGVLVLGINQATRLLHFLLDSDKCYNAELTFGLKTDTGDSYGKPIVRKLSDHINKEMVEKTLSKFNGRIQQIPPMTSAIKMQGKRLYELAREGKTIERNSRPVTIKDIKLIDFSKDGDEIKTLFHVKCSKGTYIRTLCEDIASELGTVGNMSSLIRTQVGNYNVNKAYSLDELEQRISNNIFDFIIPMENIVDDLGFFKYYVNENELKKIRNGASIESDMIKGYMDIIALYSTQQEFIALGRAENGIIKIDKVFKRG